ncbi:beta-N-acetylhexosaminidase [Rhodobium orientis]|uniref:Beta-hexosaminidase n=1 Tax=Rhodobium orientis TaxID=34017 RepID=A0A327JVT5_9HYPH|nr:glycoside hydrolase family 3 N-terminal domain-containing protein [Rhodobium orientis]MBB4301054.1 beta-N-acetylhexosaminidase [Rhodobium orientis]MBK5949722.1 beta-hexosaminidase [Rhodobium orientis]RAI30161.1 beta-hexosaminidase [Rhodobium orientis]
MSPDAASDDLARDAFAVLLPAFASLDCHAVALPLLECGCTSILIGETRAEYLARRMSVERLAAETEAVFSGAIARLREACPDLIVAVDQEPIGIRRLQGLMPFLAEGEDIRELDSATIEHRAAEMARAARRLAVTAFLAPILDVVTGRNAWLSGRTLGASPEDVGRIGAAYIRGARAAGIAAVAKHFPGFNELARDPAMYDVSLETPRETLIADALPFRAAIAAGVSGIMAGPAPVAALDPDNAACTSRAVIDLLKGEFGFEGLVVTDDLDAPATLRGRPVAEVAVTALAAGADLLLVVGGPHLHEVADGILDAVAAGTLPQERLRDAARRVRAFAAGPGAVSRNGRC